MLFVYVIKSTDIIDVFLFLEIFFIVGNFWLFKLSSIPKLRSTFSVNFLFFR
ncbi:unnamed protein product [Meloidogyne enterolobii]|uniref:Uncharacterized protein n=1 Tax=Meloidogyne enterolobii TaxID=390850 RepID=A0ACB1A1H1_MELEN